MILQALNELYHRLADDPAYEIAPPGFSPQKISLRIVLKPDGSLFAIEDARSPDEKGKLQNVVILVPGEGKSPGSGLNPCTLWDNTAYLLGYKKPDKDEKKAAKEAARAIESFAASQAHHLALESTINDPSFSAVCRFFENWKPERISDFPHVADLGTGFGIFVIQGEKRAVHESKGVQEWWRSSFESEDSEPKQMAQCLLTGEVGPVARLHPKIKGVTGTQSSGAPLVSFNEKAYHSYLNLPPHESKGPQGKVSPISEEAAFRYGTALNSLLTGPRWKKHRIPIGDTTTVFWTEKPTLVEDLFADIFSGVSQAIEETQDVTRRVQLQQLLEAIRSGSCYEERGESQTPFYILGLAPNAARISIRFFHRSTIADLVAKLHDHHDCMKIVRSATDPEFPSIRQILSQIRVLHRSEEDGAVTWKEGRDGSDKFISMIGGGLARSIVEGVAYPDALFSAVIRRSVIERRISYLRASTLKGILTRNHKLTIPVMLDPENIHPAYLHGRLFAVLEKIQEEGYYAQTKQRLKSSIKEKYFSSACATPAAVFPRIETLSVHHQRHLNPGRKIQFDKVIAEIKWPLSGTKKTHSLVEQGVFILGYYHQRKALFQGDPSEEMEMTAELDPA